MSLFLRATRNVDFTKAPEVQELITGLIKAETSAPMRHVPTFNNQLPILLWYLHDSCDVNGFSHMTVESIRARTLTLISLVGMCRPADLVLPRLTRNNCSFHTENSRVQSNGEGRPDDGPTRRRFADIVLLGLKNDYKRDGHLLRVYQADTEQVCPVRHLEAYLQRTEVAAQSYCMHHGLEPGESPLFLSVGTTTTALKPATVSKILVSILRQAGVTDSHITARAFRATGATEAFNNGMLLVDVLQAGRWAESSGGLVLKHYIRPSARRDATAHILTGFQQVHRAQSPSASASSDEEFQDEMSWSS
jgi:hypothetical protein